MIDCDDRRLGIFTYPSPAHSDAVASADVQTKIGVASIEVGAHGLRKIGLPRVDVDVLHSLPIHVRVAPSRLEGRTTLSSVGLHIPLLAADAICDCSSPDGVHTWPRQEARSWDGAAPADILSAASRDIQLFFEGELDPERLWFDFPLELPPASDFSRRVMLGMMRIPPGGVSTYGALAAAAGRPKAARAVGVLASSNLIPLFVPCHRVVGARGALTGYGGGLPLKILLLAMEQAILERAKVRPTSAATFSADMQS